MKREIIIPAYAALLMISAPSCNNNIEANKQTSPNNTSDNFKQSLVVNIMSVARKSPDDVEKVLGKPSRVIKNPKDCANLDKCNLEIRYKKDGITVLYYNKRALWFEFDNLDTLLWRNKPEVFGLKNIPPTKSTDMFDHYNNFPGLKNVAFIPSKKTSDCISYAIITVE
jgi:hypothetical protein